MGLEPIIFNSIVPTPLLAFAVLCFKAAFGVMVTASHNPKQDNGYKIYNHLGCQICNSDERSISSMIQSFEDPLPRLTEIAIENNIDSHGAVLADYFKALLHECKAYNLGAPVTKQIVYTPLHGVGQFYVDKLLEAAGLPKMIPVPEQSLPDPEFPTVKYPNPEEGFSVLVPFIFFIYT